MRFSLIETWFCFTVATLCTFVFGVSGLILSIGYVGVRALFGRSLSARMSGVFLVTTSLCLYVSYLGLPIAPNAARRMSSSNDLALARGAIQDYVAEHGVLPWLDESHPQLSWRVKVLPHIGLRDVYDRLDLSQPWDSPTNRPTLARMPNPFPRTVFDSEVFCIRTSQPPEIGTPSILLVEMAATPTHWAALEKDPTPSEFLDQHVPSIHTTESYYTTFYHWPSGTHVVLSSWQLWFTESKLSRSFWEMLVSPTEGDYSELDVAMSGERPYFEPELRHDKMIGLIALVVFVVLHGCWLIRSRRRAQVAGNVSTVTMEEPTMEGS